MTTTADTGHGPTAVMCFRPRRYYLIVGVVSAVFFVMIGVTSTVVAYFNIDGSFARPRLAAMIFAVFWSGFTLLAAWRIAAYLRERLFLANNTIVQHGIFRSRTLDVGDVYQVKWRNWPVGGSIVVRTHSEKVKIHLDNFTKGEREEVVLFFRDTFADEIHDNWWHFEECAHSLSSPGKCVSRGAIVLIVAALMCFAGLFVYCWFAGLGAQYLFLGVVNAVAAIWYLCRLRFVNRLMEESESQD
jgi:hypothetical protein